MRLLLDTCVVIDMLTDWDGIDCHVQSLIEDADNILFASFETMRELVIHFNNKRLLSKHWKTADDVLNTVEQDLNIEILPLRRDVAHVYARLRRNEAMSHQDPSDHVIIAHAIAEHMTLLSSDRKFAFYREQGLELIEY